MEEIRSKYQQKNYRLAAMTEIDCSYCRGTFFVDLGDAPIHYDRPDTCFVEIHCPYCMKEIWYHI